jgi:hypothetical protein
LTGDVGEAAVVNAAYIAARIAQHQPGRHPALSN